MMTVEEFLALPEDGTDRELIRGRLRSWPRRFHTPRHGITLTHLISSLGRWQDGQPEPRGEVLGYTAPFRLRRDPDTLIGADAGVASAGLMAATAAGLYYLAGPPILAVEILAPWDTHEDVIEKIDLDLEAGVIVWEADPDLRIVRVHRPGREPEMFNATQELPGGPYLPGFRVAVAKLFA